MSDNTWNQQDGLWGPETHFPLLTPQNPDRRPPAAPIGTANQRAQQLVQQRLRAAAVPRDDEEHTDDREVDERDHERVFVRIRWEHTTRYEADLNVDPWVSDDDLFTRLDTLPHSQRREIDIVDGGNYLISVVDLDGDGHIDNYEMSAGLVRTGATLPTASTKRSPRAQHGPR